MRFASDVLEMGEGVADVEAGIGGMVVYVGGRCVQPDEQPADKENSEEEPGGAALEGGHASNIIKKIGPDLSVNSLLNMVDRASVGTGRGWDGRAGGLAVSGLVLFWGGRYNANRQQKLTRVNRMNS